MSHKLADTIAQLQRKADHCAWLFQTHRLSTELRIAYATGVPCPWRLIEIHRNQNAGVVLRRMHCYQNEQTLRKSIEERRLWKMRDRALVAAQLSGPRFSLAKRDDPNLDEKRRALRESLCVTKATYVVNLPLDRLVRKPSSTRTQHQPWL